MANFKTVIRYSPVLLCKPPPSQQSTVSSSPEEVHRLNPLISKSTRLKTVASSRTQRGGEGAKKERDLQEGDIFRNSPVDCLIPQSPKLQPSVTHNTTTNPNLG
jgi:hypothetical protein